MLYPNIEVSRPNYRPSKTVFKKPCIPLTTMKEAFSPSRSQMTSVSEAETRATSAEKKQGGYSIAPTKYSTLSQIELERLLWHQLFKNPSLYIDKKKLSKGKGTEISVPNFAPTEKRMPVFKIVNKKNESRLKLECELDQRNKPNVCTYSPDDRKTKTRLPLFTFPKGHRGTKTPSPDKQKPLHVS